jgi:hypothetical protein
MEESTWARFKLRQKQKEHEEVYRRRKTTVEPVFGQIKSGMGFVHFLCRGLGKVKSEWNLVCGAFNLKKMLLWRQREAAGPAPPGGTGRRKPGNVRQWRLSCALFPGAIAENPL